MVCGTRSNSTRAKPASSRRERACESVYAQVTHRVRADSSPQTLTSHIREVEEGLPALPKRCTDRREQREFVSVSANEGIHADYDVNNTDKR